MTGSIKRVTTNYGAPIPVFDSPQWGVLIGRAFDILDAAIYAATGLTGISGVWDNETAYIIGTRVVDEDAGTTWRCEVPHTSPATGTFAEYRSANPTHWEEVTTSLTFSGQWETGVGYSTNEFLVDGARYGIVTNPYVSGASYDADVADGNIVTLIDLSGYVTGLGDPGANGVVVRTSSLTTTARQIRGTTNQVDVADGSGVSGDPTISLPSSVTISGTFTANTLVGSLAATQLTGTIDSARMSGAYGNITGVGALNSGSITSGFGSIDIGTDPLIAGHLTLRSAGPNIEFEDTDIIGNSRIQANSATGSLVISADYNNEVVSSSIVFQIDGSTVFTFSGTALSTSLPLNAASFGGAGVAIGANYRANTTNKILSCEAVWEAAELVELTDAATIALDMSTFINAYVTIAGNRTLGNPTNMKIGQSGSISVAASGVDRTLSKSSFWKSDTAFPITIPAGQTAYLMYHVRTAGLVLVSVMLEPT